MGDEPPWKTDPGANPIIDIEAAVKSLASSVPAAVSRMSIPPGSLTAHRTVTLAAKRSRPYRPQVAEFRACEELGCELLAAYAIPIGSQPWLCEYHFRPITQYEKSRASTILFVTFDLAQMRNGAVVVDVPEHERRSISHRDPLRPIYDNRGNEPEGQVPWRFEAYRSRILIDVGDFQNRQLVGFDLGRSRYLCSTKRIGAPPGVSSSPQYAFIEELDYEPIRRPLENYLPPPPVDVELEASRLGEALDGIIKIGEKP